MCRQKNKNREKYLDNKLYKTVDTAVKSWNLNLNLNFGGGGSRREPPTLGKQLVNFITCGCESSAPFFVIYKAGHEPTSYW